MKRVRQAKNTRTFNNNQQGFGAIEILMALVIVVLVAAAGYLIYKDRAKTQPVSTNAASVKTSSSSKTTASSSGPNPSQYVGWQSFCSSYGGLCLKYPAAWKLTQASYAPGQSTTGQEVDTITSPSGGVRVSYMPSAQVTGNRQQENIKVVAVTATAVNALELVQLIDQVSGSPTQYGAEDYVTLASAAHALNKASSPFTPGAVISSTSEPPYHQFTNPLRPGDIGQQLLAVTINPTAASSNFFSSSVAAQAWLSSAEVQTAGQILDSVTYSQ